MAKKKPRWNLRLGPEEYDRILRSLGWEQGTRAFLHHYPPSEGHFVPSRDAVWSSPPTPQPLMFSRQLMKKAPAYQRQAKHFRGAAQEGAEELLDYCHKLRQTWIREGFLEGVRGAYLTLEEAAQKETEAERRSLIMACREYVYLLLNDGLPATPPGSPAECPEKEG